MKKNNTNVPFVKTTRGEKFFLRTSIISDGWNRLTKSAVRDALRVLRGTPEGYRTDAGGYGMLKHHNTGQVSVGCKTFSPYAVAKIRRWAFAGLATKSRKAKR